MKIATIAVARLPLHGAAFAAESFEFCPDENTINAAGRFFLAPTPSGQGEWLGMAPADSAGKIKGFVSAIFYPAEGSGIEKGQRSKCTYSTEYSVQKRGVDMRYKPNQPSSVMLTNTSAWVKKTSSFGMSYYECTAPRAAQCQFKELAH